MILYLQHQRSDGEVDTYHLKPGRRYHIGRGSTCEVRILDLKLSRRHAALEWLEGGWRLIDLGSTNGCRLDGEEVTGMAVVRAGMRIEAGHSRLVVAHLAEPAEDPDSSAARRAASREWLPDDEASASTVVGLRPTALERPPAAPIPEAMGSDPTPRYTPSLAVPGPTPMPAPAEQISGDPAQAVTSPVAAGAFFVTVLGRRIGPLDRAQARELKVRELRGDLRPEDLDGLPQG